MRWLEAMLLCACACSAPAPPPAPAPAPSAPIAMAAPAPTPVAPAPEPSAVATAEPPPPVDPGPAVTIELEPPYKLGERPEPKTQAEYRADILERRFWNSGGLGDLAGEQLPVDGHPDPRVIVNVVDVDGPHDAKKIERVARKYHWMHVIRCYQLGAWKDPLLRGWTKARVRIGGDGTARKPKLLETELADEEVARCMVKKLADIEYPRASAASGVRFEMRVSPGDDPMPPPEEEAVPGDGTLDLEAMRAGVESGRAALETCYRAGLAYAPALWGRLLVRFHLTDRGVLDEAFEAGSRFPDPRTRQCLLRELRKLKFPRPAGGEIRFVVPIRFYTDRAPQKGSGGDEAPPETP
jgi:hypothetical protein